ncbi:hypothetical protein [Halomicronema hongdechloris]|uniref:hypothetical protein n=1 Tax=Halomicronema hongdechloris TaxID=1209493 RepID=UPI001651569E|nr:hypothetical protein [Halomicronema hongdechloris]
MATAVAAAFVGGGIGLALRLLPLSAAGNHRLDPAQSFPSLSDWSETEESVDFGSPYLEPDQGPINRAEEELLESDLEWSEEPEVRARDAFPELTPFSPTLEAAERLPEAPSRQSDAEPLPEPAAAPSAETQPPASTSPPPRTAPRTNSEASPASEREVTETDESTLDRDSIEPQVRSHPDAAAEDTAGDDPAKSAIKPRNNLNRDG